MPRLLALHALGPLPLDIRIKIFRLAFPYSERDCAVWLRNRSPSRPGDRYFTESCDDIDGFLIDFVFGGNRETKKTVKFRGKRSKGYWIPADRDWIRIRAHLLGLEDDDPMDCSDTFGHLCVHWSIKKPPGWFLDLDPEVRRPRREDVWYHHEDYYVYCEECQKLHIDEQLRVFRDQLLCDDCIDIVCGRLEDWEL